eukprot:CAMPEP_0194757382 /NCGR_PEP_ID=MMETSP0323_2-20130528/10884_1 /TAXON_ID=2866 ORGANISM="Crypthecodinium cohnii, Strain Seligo" /NCGR_SAMPLE_ID=MMETSP0323_2 /ASSEMBLY_ACC=CAM_ASM_000346 /LENGTH=119 /DNA_ID=CAMNT_0039677291 /DNA_START=436 /DNA_END=795 /DNA_ORIENTATION=-
MYFAICFCPLCAGFFGATVFEHAGDLVVLAAIVDPSSHRLSEGKDAVTFLHCCADSSLVSPTAGSFYPLHDVQTTDDFAEDDVLAIELWGRLQQNEELGVIRVWALVRHTQQPWSRVRK